MFANQIHMDREIKHRQLRLRRDDRIRVQLAHLDTRHRMKIATAIKVLPMSMGGFVTYALTVQPK